MKFSHAVLDLNKRLFGKAYIFCLNIVYHMIDTIF